LVIGTNFVIKTMDPGRTIEVGAHMINHATYDTLVTYDGADLSTPKPNLATDWTISPDGKTYTFKLRSGVKFVSGNPLTSADVKWSLDRMINLKANTSYLVPNIQEVDAPDPQTVVIKLKNSDPGFLAILANPSMSPVDSKLVQEKGGDAGPNAKDQDKAEAYLNSTSAGTGPYTLSKYVPDQEIDLVKNPNSWRGPAKFDRIVVRNMPEPATEKLQVERGDLDIALSLDQDQVKALANSQGVTTASSPLATTFYILINNNPQVGGAFSNPKVQEAMRYALDYDGIMTIAGKGAVRLAGVIPTNFYGYRDPSEAPKKDVQKAKDLLKEANVGQITGKLTYGNDGSVQGVPMDLLAQKIQSDLAAVGINIQLDGMPRTAALQLYRDGKNQLGLWSWAADWPDPSDFLTYAPGQTVGKRAGWPEDATPEAKQLADLARQAQSELDKTKRTALYKQFDTMVSTIGPYIPLFQPAAPYAYRSDLKGVTYNSVWQLDLAAISK